MSVSRCFFMISSVLSLFLSWRRYLKTHSFYLKDLCNTVMKARIIANNLFFVFFCVQWCCLDSRQGLITGRKDLTLASIYIYIHVSYVYTTHSQSTVSYANIMAEINFDSIGISDEEMEISETVQKPSKYLVNVSTLINKHICTTWW